MVKQYITLLSPLFTISRKEVKSGRGGFLILFILLGWSLGFGQTSTQNFGTSAASQTSATGSTAIIPNPTSGTTWARGGATAPNAPIVLATTSNPLGTTGAFARGVASTSTSVSKFSPWVGYTGGTEFYTSFKVLFGDSAGGSTATSGTWSFFQGAGVMYSDANNFTSAQVFTGLFFTYGAGGTITLTYRLAGATVNTGLTQTTLNSATPYTIEIIGNNKTSGTINYTYNGNSRSVAVQKFDLYLNGVLIGDDLGESSLPANTSIASGTFIGLSSTSNVANIFVDDAITYNAVPASIGVAPATTVALADNGTQVAAANVNQGTTNVVLNKIQLGVTTANATLTGMTCTTTGSYAVGDLTNLKVRYSADATLDSGDATLSTLTTTLTTAGTQTFPSFTPQTITSGNTGYIFITADVKSTATHNNTIGVNAIGSANLSISGATYSPTPTTTNGGLQTFKDVTAPTVSTYNPANGATAVALASNLVLTFSENVKAGTTGTINIYDSTNTLFESFAFNSPRITFSGNTATIDPTSNLAYGTSYYVTVDAGAISDTQDVAFAGFSTNATWGFTTLFQPPANDSCSTATSLTVGITNSGGTYSGATPDYGTSRDVWYSFTPTCSGTHTIAINFPGDNSENIDFEVYSTTCPTSTTGRLQLFGGDSPGNTFIANSTNGGDETADLQTAVAGTTYYIRVIDVSDAATTFDITVTTTATPSITLANTGAPVSGNIAAGINNVVVYGFALTPSACSSAFTFSGASIATSGTAGSADLNSFRLIADTNNNGIADSGEIAAPLGSATFTNGNPLVFTFSSQTLTGATRYLLIANVNSAAGNGNTFTGSLTNSNITANQTVNGSASGNQQSITATSITIADNGTQVAAGSIFRGTNTSIIDKIKLTVGGQTASVTQFNFVTTGSYVQTDIAASGFRLWRTATNVFDTNTSIAAVSSATGNSETLSFATSESLAIGDYYYWLTVDVSSSAIPTHTIAVNGLTNTSITSAGTTITGSSTAAGIQTIISPTLTIADNTQITTQNLLVNSTNNIISKAQFTPTVADIAVTGINFVTAGNYVSTDVVGNGFNLWLTTSNTFAATTPFGTSQSSVTGNGETIAFSDSQTLTVGTTYYFWLTAEIDPSATLGHTLVVNGLSASNVASSTVGVFKSGSTTSTGNQTITATAPGLTTAAASVDAPFSITLSPDNTNYRGAITSVKIGATSLAFTTSAGNITLDPANASNTLLRTPGNKTIDITAANYTAAQVTQLMLVGAPAKLSVATQPTAPSTNGAVLAQQPVISILDQYNNATTSAQSVQATVGAGTWTLGGANAVNGVSGTATFTNLTATSAALVTGATITFSLPNISGATVLATSGMFNIPAPSASQIAFSVVPATAVTNSNLSTVKIEARTVGGAVDTSYTGNVTLSATGPGNLTATTLSKAAVAGVATFNDLKFDTAGSYTLKADSSTFTQITTPVSVVDPIAKWTFEGVTTTNTGATVVVSGGSAVADAGLQTSGSSFTGVHAAAGTIWSNVAGNGSAKSVSSNNWAVGDYFQFRVNTTGFTTIKVLYDQTGSNTGPKDFKLQYSTTAGGASGYTDFGSYSLPQATAATAVAWSSTAASATSLSTISFDLSAIPVLNSTTEAYFRIVNTSTISFVNGGTVASTGTGRVDNFTVLGTACTPSAPTGSLAITNSTCASACTVSGGSIAIGTVAGSGGTLQYSLNGGSTWSSTLPTYAAPQTILASVLSVSGCRSTSITVGSTVAGTCTTPSAPTGSLSITDSTCASACTVSGGSIAIGTVSGSGGTLQYSLNGGTTWNSTLPTYAAPQTILASVVNASGCRSTSTTVGSTVAGTCTTPSAPIGSLAITDSTCASACTVSGGSIAIGTVAGPGGTLEYSLNGGSTWSSTLPVYAAPQTILGSVVSAGGCRSTITTVGSTVAGTCTTPATPTITAGGPTTFCSGGNVVLTASSGNGYLWSNSATTASITVTATGNFTVQVSNASGCFSAASTVTSVTATAQPNWYLDADGDHYYTGAAIASCTSPGAGYTTTVTGGGDCDDSNAAINPGATEICYNNIDDNCNGTKSESCAAVVVNMTPSYNNTTLPSLSTAVPAVAYTYAPYTNIKYRFSVTNLSTNQTAPDIIQVSRYITIPASIHSYNASYSIKVSADINDEVVPFAGNTIIVNSPSVQLITLSSGSCGATLASLTSTITANAGLNATGYTFRIRLASDNGPTPAYAYSSSASRFVSANSFTGFPLSYGTSYKVAVQYTFNDPVTNLPVDSGYGAECTVNTASIPLTGLASPACGSQVAAMNANISATSASYATAYQFRIRLTSDNGPTPTYYTSVPNASRFSSLTAFQGITYAYNTQYSISVQYSIVNNSATVWSGYGAECIVQTPFFPTTGLVPSQCGLSTPTSLTQQLNVTPYPGFPNYKVKLDEISGEDVVNSQEIVITYPYFKLSQFSIAQLGRNYNVSVAIKQNGVFGDYATACDLFTQDPSGGVAGGSGDVKAIMPFKATAYPNPFANNFMIDVKTSSQSTVNLKVYDMIGRLIDQRDVRMSDIENTTIGDQYPSGVYNVVVSQEDSIETVRAVKR